MAELDRADIETLLAELRDALVRLRRVEELDAGQLEPAQREALVQVLEELQVDSTHILENFGKRCSFCRVAPAEMVGQCAKCGADACTNCATAYEGVILHSGTCAAFYHGEPDA